MRAGVGIGLALALLSAAGCYSHTKEVVVERRVPVPSGCTHADWVPPLGGVPGYWRCTT